MMIVVVVVVVIVIVVVVVVVVFALKGVIRDLYNLSSSSNSSSSSSRRLYNLQHLCSSGQGAIVCTCNTLRATLKSFHFSFILLAKPIHQSKRGGSRSTRRKPLTTRDPHTVR